MSVQELDDAEQVLDALREGRVQTLLVHDDEDDDFDKGQRILDVCIKQALLTGADIHVVPNVSILSSGVAAITRW
jgi:stalled ribosome rescue protein Dom34